jgi:hypothetical protein
MRKYHESEESKTKYKFFKESSIDEDQTMKSIRNPPKYSKSNNFSQLIGLNSEEKMTGVAKRNNFKRMNTNKVNGHWFKGLGYQRKKVGKPII